MVNRENVQRLVNAAWDGMAVSLAQEPASAEDVINAALNIARQAIHYACSSGPSGVEHEHNRQVLRDTVQKLLLDTVDEKSGPVM